MLRHLLSAGLLAVAAGPVWSQTASIVVPPTADSGGGQAAPLALPPVAPAALPSVYFTADEMPAFPGGDAALLKFLSGRLNYPTAALDKRLSGKVFITFTVDPEGHLHNPRVVRGLGSGLDEEALRLVRLMPWWSPGKIQGHSVWVTLTMPIVFRAL